LLVAGVHNTSANLAATWKHIAEWRTNQMFALWQHFLSLRTATLLWSLAAITVASASAGDDPTVGFDFPRTIACREVTPPDFGDVSPGEMVIEAVLPVSVIVYRGDVHRIEELVIEIDGASYGLHVHEYAPMTRLDSDIIEPMEVTTTSESGTTLEATLGGKLPIPGAEAAACLTPSITGGKTDREVSTETVNRLAPKQAVVVSGTTSKAQAVFFKFRKSTQTTLEGQHEVSVKFVVPREWTVSELQVTVVARGQKKWLWYDQPHTFSSLISTVQLYRAGDAELRASALARAEKITKRGKHEVAKPILAEK
jgi:hypothetical protein